MLTSRDIVAEGLQRSDGVQGRKAAIVGSRGIGEHFLSAPGVLRTPRLLAILSYLLIKSYYGTGTEPLVSLDRNLITSEGQAPLCHPIRVTLRAQQARRFTASDSLQRGRVDAAVLKGALASATVAFWNLHFADFMLLSAPRGSQELHPPGGCVCVKGRKSRGMNFII